ncbi:MAG: IS4 family transposase [Waterburya sp.]
MLPELYQNHFQKHLKPCDYLLLEIMINLLQSIKQVNLEKLATSLPLPILFESRSKKIQRFLSLPEWNVKTIWLALISQWINTSIARQEVLHLAIDRTRWQSINILVISWIYNRRAIPLYFELLEKKGNSNLSEQTESIAHVISKFKKYKMVFLGDREFCSVDLASWLREKKVYFCLRLKKNNFVELESEIWCQLQQLGLKPGISFDLRGVKMTKTKQVAGFDLAAKWQKRRDGLTPEEGWFILTNLGSLESAITAYKKRFGIEEMFRDFKKGGYNLEGTKVTGDRLISLLILISIAYTVSTFSGQKIKSTGIQKYIGRVKESKRTFSRHSNFYIGLYGYSWLNFCFDLSEKITQLMNLSPNKRPFYQRGQKAMTLILSAF